MNYYENYTKQMKQMLLEYEKAIELQKSYSTNYIAERKALFKDIEEQFNMEMNKLQYMNIVDIYLNTTNLNLPKMYWNAYVLWLEKVKLVYNLDNDYLKQIIQTSNGILQLNPLLKAYSSFDVYKHFNFMKPNDSK